MRLEYNRHLAFEGALFCCSRAKLQCFFFPNGVLFFSPATLSDMSRGSGTWRELVTVCYPYVWTILTRCDIGCLVYNGSRVYFPHREVKTVGLLTLLNKEGRCLFRLGVFKNTHLQTITSTSVLSGTMKVESVVVNLVFGVLDKTVCVV